jgi:starch-binding outer membrane protein, SusD/RagB family
MKIKYFISLLAISLFCVVGCEDLDTLPEGDIVTTSIKEEVLENDPSKAEAGVNAIFAQFSQLFPNEEVLNRENHNDFGYPSVMMFTDMNGNDVLSEDIGYNWATDNLDYNDRDYTGRSTQIIWNDMYKIISACNTIIGSISKETTDPQSGYYLAQALSVRAFSYWTLAQLYQFNYKGNESKPCVPIITDENSNDAALNGAPRATNQEVYDLMISDIDLAVSLLNLAESNGVVRADKRYISLGVAYGLQARINLTMQNWVAAATAATNAIQASTANPASIADVGEPTFSEITESNWMWGIIIAETDGVVTSGIVNWISHMGSLNWGYCFYNGGRQINMDLFNSIPATDVRKGWWIGADGTSPNLTPAQQLTMDGQGYRPYTHVKFAPYNDELETTTNANDVPLMRIEEMYLIKAEAEAMSGGNGKTTLENFVQTYRDPSYVCTATDIQKEVFHQRRIELWGEGLNWYDIMRLNKGVDRRGAGYPNASMIFNIEPGSDILLWRIPEAEIQANIGLNEGDNNPSAPAPLPVPDN